MNSQALVKVDTRESWMERRLGARNARLLLAAGGTVAVTLSVPTSLLENVATASGLSEMVKFFAPPIGLGSRLLLGGALALVPAAVVWIVWGGEPAEPSKPRPNYEAEFQEIEDEDEMMHARKQSSGGSAWGSLIRLVRGGFHDNAEAQDGALNRRRRDSHPDAPPRPPLFASRDLPSPEPVEAMAPVAEAAAPVQPAVAGFSDALARAAPEPVVTPMPEPVMPRAPAPLSEEEIAHVVAAIPRRAPAPRSLPRGTTSELLRELDLPLIDGTDLCALAARFERSLTKREAIVHAQEAQQSMTERMAFAHPDESVRAALRAQPPVEVLTPPSPAPAAPGDLSLRVDRDVEQALNTALATLRKLTEQGRR